jgi:hypothetical protein
MHAGQDRRGMAATPPVEPARPVPAPVATGSAAPVAPRVAAAQREAEPA